MSFFFSSQVFKGNKNNNSVVINSISNPVEARFARFIPQTWKNSIAMRVEVYGEVIGKFISFAHYRPAHFRVVFCLFIKTNLRAKPFI